MGNTAHRRDSTQKRQEEERESQATESGWSGGMAPEIRKSKDEAGQTVKRASQELGKPGA